jgi:polyhydroxyalkanoate synthesis repressor PhaR
MDRKTVVIKKYENRRLYDTENSRYVNLDEVAEMVRDGVDVQVVDAVTGEDLTRVVLTQIIVDSAKSPGSAFPLDMLRQMVMASGQLSQESMLKYMRAMFEVYQNAYRTFSPPLNPFDLMHMMSPGARPPAAGGPSKPDSVPPAPEVDELRRRIEELESAIAGRRSARSPGKRKPAARRPRN